MIAKTGTSDRRQPGKTGSNVPSAIARLSSSLTPRLMPQPATLSACRLLVVGGAGSLFVAPGVQLVDTPQFPAAYKQGALAARQALNEIKTETNLDWTFVSPPIGLAPGERTGKYRLGSDELLPGKSTAEPAGISLADLAVAIVDALETPRHVRRRFTVAK